MDKKEKEKELQRLISLTFDENPEVRKKAALMLADSNEPAALFALFELSYDKDPTVKSTVQEILSKKKSSGDKDVISFADLFDKQSEAVVESQSILRSPTPEDDLKKKKLLDPIEQIFEKRLGKNKAALIKEKMMSTIEKIYLKAVGSKTGQSSEESQKREKAMQKMLTSYADVLSSLGTIALAERQAREANIVDVQTVQTPNTPQPEELTSGTSEVLEEVGNKVDSSKIANEISNLNEEEDEIKMEINKAGTMVDASIFRKAYDLMMASDGDEEVMFQQSQRLIKQLKDEVNLAFRIAKQRFKSENITHLTELKHGMRNVNTDVLLVKGVSRGEYQRTKTKKDSYTRIVVNDNEGSEGVIYLFEGRGKEVQPGMKVKVVKGQVKTFEFSKETAITIGKKGNVYIVL